ncbi:nuclear transport factor 2 family protein [Streptomyces griseorubiginosus]|uniref:nuclear transport factor 2 family protein n=1 Tax=Streptomyces TaxID=1883 RepID=UPI0033E1A5D2
MGTDMDIDAVREVIGKYVAGVSASDPELVGSAFRPDAHMWGYLGEELVTVPIGRFLDVVAGSPDPALWLDGYTHTVRSVEITGNVAAAVLEETGYLGSDFTNYFTLVREKGEWAIASKTFFLTGGQTPPAP